MIVVKENEIPKKPEPKPWQGLTLAMMVLCYSGWVLAGLTWQTSLWWAGLPVMAVSTAFSTSLQHETIHGHPTPHAWLNEFLVSLPLAVIFPYRRYRDLHLQHHNDMNLTDPYEDPESYFWPLSSYQTMRPVMQILFRFNNTFVGRLVVGPGLSMIGFARTELLRLRKGEAGVRKAWVLHAVGLAPLWIIVTQVFAMPVWIYLLFAVYPGLSLVAMRSYAEHQAAENVGARSAVVETVKPLALLYLNNNLHIVHHANPNVAWYKLPALYEERKQQFLAANENTLFNGYSDIARRFAFRSKQPVCHPYLYQEDQPAE